MLGGVFRRVLGACTALILGPREASDPVVRDLQRRVTQLEDDLEHERRERKLLAGEVEAQLDQATRRYSKARAAESRAEKATETENGDPAGRLLATDPEAYRELLSSRGSNW